jgi:hypothetical protein
MPEWVVPQLTQLVDAAPGDDEWLHKIKFDGYRMHARLARPHSAKSAPAIFGPTLRARRGRTIQSRTRFIWRLQLCDR